jgi:16S rRNA (guanine(527)-N(7))-methyltransferase RsmG
MSSDLAQSLRNHEVVFGLDLPDETVGRLERYYKLLVEHNPILHLIGPMDTEEFAIRHILESLTLLRHLPEKTRFADVGSGGGLPAIPCLLARDDLMAVLIESKEKKTKFLELAVEELGLAKRVSVVTRQFHEVEPGGCTIVTCRALDKFTEKLGRLLKWSMRRNLLLFGGPNLEKALRDQNAVFDGALMPMSDQRYLFVVRRERLPNIEVVFPKPPVEC